MNRSFGRNSFLGILGFSLTVLTSVVNAQSYSFGEHRDLDSAAPVPVDSASLRPTVVQQSTSYRNGMNSGGIGFHSNDSTSIGQTNLNGSSANVGLKNVTPTMPNPITCSNNFPSASANAIAIGPNESATGGKCTFEPMYENMTTPLSAGNLNQTRIVTYQSSGQSCNSSVGTGTLSKTSGSAQFVCTEGGWVLQQPPSCNTMTLQMSSSNYKENCY